VQCCPFSWSVATTEVIAIIACIRKISIGTTVVACIGDTSLGPLNCLFAAKKRQNAEMKQLFRHVDVTTLPWLLLNFVDPTSTPFSR
jgi:hypothetical protein